MCGGRNWKTQIRVREKYCVLFRRWFHIAFLAEDALLWLPSLLHDASYISEDKHVFRLDEISFPYTFECESIIASEKDLYNSIRRRNREDRASGFRSCGLKNEKCTELPTLGPYKEARNTGCFKPFYTHFNPSTQCYFPVPYMSVNGLEL